MSTCNNDCKNCKDKNNCNMESKIINDFSNIKKVIAVGSGKGGVGKSLVASLLATKFRKEGLSVGILDADITGPSIPRTFGIDGKATINKDYIVPIESKLGIKIVSINMFLDNKSDPVIWRGPILSNTVTQFFQNTMWGDLDCLIIDMPPGTADIVLTIYQSLPIDGLIIVTSPQDLVNLIVEKSYNMAKQMEIKILGLVENMSYLKCDKCDNKINIFGESKIGELAIKLDTKVIEKIPLDTKLTKYIDSGNIEKYENELFKNFKLN